MTDLVAARPAHAAVLAAIHAEAFPPAGRWGAEAMALQLAVRGAYGWIDLVGGMILARVVADEAEVLTLAVAPGARRLGVGRRLLARALESARASGAGTMVLEVGVLNAPARALYASVGFKTVGRRARYYADGEDALILRVGPCG